jgi:hypothetical protein
MDEDGLLHKEGVDTHSQAVGQLLPGRFLAMVRIEQRGTVSGLYNSSGGLGAILGASLGASRPRCCCFIPDPF